MSIQHFRVALIPFFAAFCLPVFAHPETKPSCGGIFRRLIERDSDARYSQALQFSM